MMVMIMAPKAMGAANGRTLRIVGFLPRRLMSPNSRTNRMARRFRIRTRAASANRLFDLITLG